MPKKANFYIEKSGVIRKIFKIFIDNKEDLYFNFSNCTSKEYKSGYATIKTGESELTYNPTIEGKSSSIPLKLSYHQDGQMHFKTIDNSKIKMPAHYKLAEMKTTPFIELGDSHFMTIDLEGLENFEPSKIKAKNEYHRVFKADDNTIRYKFIFAGSSNPEETVRKYSPIEIVSIERKTAPNPLNIAIQFQSFNTSLGKNYKKENLLFNIICGFRTEDNTLEKDMKFLYLFTK